MNIAHVVERAKGKGRIKDGLVLCDNCDIPASKSLARGVDLATAPATDPKTPAEAKTSGGNTARERA
jgi:hypothetical protein